MSRDIPKSVKFMTVCINVLLIVMTIHATMITYGEFEFRRLMGIMVLSILLVTFNLVTYEFWRIGK
jgi:hypothetical protein